MLVVGTNRSSPEHARHRRDDRGAALEDPDAPRSARHHDRVAGPRRRHRHTGVSAAGANGPGATFRGAIVALNAQTGSMLWRSYSLPDNTAFQAATPAPRCSRRRRSTWRTARVRHVRDSCTRSRRASLACHAASPAAFSESCEQPGAYWKSIVAFELIRARRVVVPGAAATRPGCRRAAASRPVTWCAAESDGEKWDIGGSGANVMRLRWRTLARRRRRRREERRLLPPRCEDRGVHLEHPHRPRRRPGRHGVGHGVRRRRIYASITNHHHIPYKLTQNGVISNTTVTGGSWAALDPVTGRILWQTADPQVETLPGLGHGRRVGPRSGDAWRTASSTWRRWPRSRPTRCSRSTRRPASILWQFAAGSSVNAGPAVVNGTVYWGSGYARSGGGQRQQQALRLQHRRARRHDPPTTTIALSPPAPNGTNGWYRTPVGVTVTAADNAGGVGVYQTRCVLDPATPPASFDALPDGDCNVTSVSAIGAHTLYAASEDRNNNVESPVVSRSFKLVTSDGLCALTREDVRGSTRYRAGGLAQRIIADTWVEIGCRTPRLDRARASSRCTGRRSVRIYEQVVACCALRATDGGAGGRAGHVRARSLTAAPPGLPGAVACRQGACQYRVMTEPANTQAAPAAVTARERHRAVRVAPRLR